MKKIRLNVKQRLKGYADLPLVLIEYFSLDFNRLNLVGGENAVIVYAPSATEWLYVLTKILFISLNFSRQCLLTFWTCFVMDSQNNRWIRLYYLHRKSMRISGKSKTACVKTTPPKKWYNKYIFSIAQEAVSNIVVRNRFYCIESALWKAWFMVSRSKMNNPSHTHTHTHTKRQRQQQSSGKSCPRFPLRQ